MDSNIKTIDNLEKLEKLNLSEITVTENALLIYLWFERIDTSELHEDQQFWPEKAH